MEEWGYASELDDVRGEVAIVGIGETAYTKASGRTARDIGIEAAERAIADAGLEPADIDVLQVAAASEVTILRIEGADTEAVIVGEMPVSGALDLAASGEVCITCKCPRVNVRQNPPYRPMVWARLDPE